MTSTTPTYDAIKAKLDRAAAIEKAARAVIETGLAEGRIVSPVVKGQIELLRQAIECGAAPKGWTHAETSTEDDDAEHMRQARMAGDMDA